MRSVAIAIALAGLVACSMQTGRSGRGESATASLRPLAAMRTRDYKVTWLSGQRLRIEDAEGTLIADNVSIDDVARIDPFLRTACTNAEATGYVDAELSRRARSPMQAGLERTDFSR